MSRLVDHLIILFDGGELVTLRDAGEYIQALPALESWNGRRRPILDRDRRGRDFMMHARIATLRAWQSVNKPDHCE